VRRNTLEQARIQASLAYDKDLLYRRWNAGHGGVYVPATEQTPPNPYLEGVPERDLTSPAGRRLTLVNPAYMTRQINEMGRREHGVVGHLTSLKPQRPENAPDPWEARALALFERGVKEVVSAELLDGEEFLRLMRPMVTEPACLKCHAGQGYRVGDIHGGISVSVPLAPMRAIARRQETLIAARHLALLLLGLGFVAVSGARLLRSDRERTAAEEGLRRERETLRLLYEASPDAVAVIDRDYRLIYANRRVEELSGVPLAQLRGKSCHEGILGRPHPCEECLVAEVFREGRPAGRVKREVTAAGRENWLQQQWYPVRGADGTVESVVEIARDVTDLKRAEAELQTYAANLEEVDRLKDLFTDIMSHDLLNPATASRYFLEVLREGERDPRRQRTLDIVDHNLEKLVDMIRNASTFSKLKETRELAVREADLGAVVREALDDLEPQLRGAGMTVEGPPAGTYPAEVHPMFGNVVANLVGNAVKYAAAGGRVAVGIADAGAEWTLSVRDWGEGIPDEHKQSIFTRFERIGKAGVKGTGLGLAIARRIVELHGGRIWIEDNPEGGSVFLVSVRKAAAAAARPLPGGDVDPDVCGGGAVS
jgi:PAS domain S-box-containing protein